MAIIGILAGLVAGALTGTRGSANESRLSVDRNSILKAAQAFFTDSFPQSYPTVALGSTDQALVSATAGDLGVRLINFDAPLPQADTKRFAPDYLKEIPVSAVQVSWRISVRTGDVFFAAQRAPLIFRSDSRLDVSAADPTLGQPSEYRLRLGVNRFEAAIDELRVQIPTGYSIGAASQDAGDKVGKLEIVFGRDNPWDVSETTGEEITVAPADVVATGRANEWEAVVNYDLNSSTSGLTNIDVKELGPSTRIHRFSIRPPSKNTPGRLTLTMDRTGDPEENEAAETFTLTIFAHPLDASNGFVEAPGLNIVTNPAIDAAYNWIAEEHTSIDLDKALNQVPGSQVVIVR